MASLSCEMELSTISPIGIDDQILFGPNDMLRIFVQYYFYLGGDGFGSKRGCSGACFSAGTVVSL